MSKKKCGLITGLLVGTGIGILVAPKKGSETRKDLTNKINELLDKVKTLDADEIKENIENKIIELKLELEDLDKEKVAKIARDKANALKKKAEELYKLAVKKGTPILEKAAEEVREKTIEFLSNTIEKLEKTPEVKTVTKTKK